MPEGRPATMVGRQWLYLRERYPPAQQLFVAALVFFEIYFVLLLNEGVRLFRLGAGEAVGAWTVFAFLLLLRIADDFKDHETDKQLFPERPLASGRVDQRDVWVLLGVVVAVTIGLNVAFMNNLGFFVFLFTYGFAMSMWFFAKDKIQPNLVLALITHNPVMMILNVYVISYTCFAYGLPLLTWTTFLLAWTMYFPGLIWEVARKIRAPQDETAYVTYSSLFGVPKATRFIAVLTLVDVATNMALVWPLNRWAVLVLGANVAVMTWLFTRFVADPTRFRLITKVERYTILTETTMVLAVAGYLMVGRL